MMSPDVTELEYMRDNFATRFDHVEYHEHSWNTDQTEFSALRDFGAFDKLDFVDTLFPCWYGFH